MTASLLFDQNSGYLDNTSISAALKLTTTASVQCWFKRVAGSQAFPYVVTIGADSNNTYLDCAMSKNGIDGSPGPYANMFALGAQVYADSTNANNYADGDWHDITWTRSVLGSWKIYLDAIALTVSQLAPSLPITTGSKIQVGSRFTGSTSNTNLDGYLAFLRIWDIELSAGQITANHRRPTNPAASGLAGFWKLQSDYLDSTVNANHLTGHGGLTFSATAPPLLSPTKTSSIIITT